MAWTSRGVRALGLPGRDEAATIGNILNGKNATKAGSPSKLAAAAMTAVQAHLRGEHVNLTRVPLDLEGRSAFQKRVYRALRGVAPGHTISYGELACAAGKRNAARAVGGAMARNPLPILIPCHRVVARGGGRGGFSAPGGLDTKAKLLAIEGVELG
jgi:methylated-DNA-[protein]-cysteine S-methyltransferase